MVLFICENAMYINRLTIVDMCFCVYNKKRRGKERSQAELLEKLMKLEGFVLPIETRRMLDIEPRDGVEIFLDKDMVILKKYQPAASSAVTPITLSYYRDKRICRNCLADLKKQ